MKKNNFLLFLILFITIVVVFRKFFITGPLVFGDAPFFYKEGLRELFNLPMAWISRGNSLGGVNLFLWIYPLMVIYGALGTFFHMSNDIILRILFYFPSLIFGISGVYFFVKELKFSRTVIFFATLIYLVNTYFLLLIDGGQVGIVLAYGLFPLVLFFLIKLIDHISVKNFVITLFMSFVLTIVDFRISAICFSTLFFLKLFEFRKFKILFLVLISLIGLSSYWIIPTLKLSTTAIGTGVASLQTTSLLNSLFLFSPNWPTNQFGQTVAPYFYFFLIPILIFLPLVLMKERRIVWLTFVLLFFVFFAKGESAPFGFLYTIFVNTKYGSVFRDSTKFFIPLILIGGVLIGNTVKILKKKVFYILIFLYIILLVTPAILGKLNGVLGKNPDLSNYQKIYKLISSNSGFLRDAWFDEKSPFAYHTEDKQALDAKDLVNFRPFASMNGGTGDHFNFINNPQYLDWFKLLGIKYLIFNGNPRVPHLNKSDQADWMRLSDLISKDTRLQKVNNGTSFPIYQTSNILPHEFFVDRTFIVIGGDDVYQKLLNLDQNFSVANQGFIFPEDGKFDPSILQNAASTSAIILFNQEAVNDLKMSFLQSNFVSPIQATYSHWAVRESSDFLSWKYELLQNNIDTHEFDYNKGIAFSSQPNEKLSFKLNAPQDGDYYLEIRSMAASDSGDLKVNFNNQQYFIKRMSNDNFEWFEKGPVTLSSGNYALDIENSNGFQVVNIVALVSSHDMGVANQLTQNYLGNFQHLDLQNQIDQSKIVKILDGNKWENFDINQITKPGWIIYTDSFNENWQLQRANEADSSYPMYSMINGFYIHPDWRNVKIIFKGNEYLKWGVYFSIVSGLVIIIVILWRISKK